MILNVVINTDEKYLQHAMAMLCSLYENNRCHTIHLHVLVGILPLKSKRYIEDLSEKYDNKVFWYHIDNSKLEGVQFRKIHPLSYAAYYRLLLADVLPKDIDRILYLDCDIIVLRDISEIFNLEIDDYALAATLDSIPHSSLHRNQLHMEADERAFCSGVMLVNLDYWRMHKVTGNLLSFAKRVREPVYFHDQDALNYVFKRKWFLLPPKWNRISFNRRLPRDDRFKVFDRKEYLKVPFLIHYAGPLKPWNKGICPLKSYYIKYLNLSGYNNVKFDDIDKKQRLKNLYITILFNIKTALIRILKKY